MKLVALVCPPERPDEAVGALAAAASLTFAEARMRMAPEPPALLARLAPDVADALVAALRKSGLAVVATPSHVPGDRDRLVVRSFSLDGAGAVFTSASGESTRVEWGEVLAVLRGLRATRSEVTRTERSTRFSAGVAVATGGLKMTRTVTRTVRSSDESTEQVILVYARDGRVAVLAERVVDFSCLGPAMAPSSTANMVEIGRRLRAGAPRAFHDERLLRLGRRPLPFQARGESQDRTGASTTTRSDTSGALDVLAEVMRQAVVEGLLP